MHPRNIQKSETSGNANTRLLPGHAERVPHPFRQKAEKLVFGLRELPPLSGLVHLQLDLSLLGPLPSLGFLQLARGAVVDVLPLRRGQARATQLFADPEPSRVGRA